MIRFRSDVEGLRAVAVLLVILNHLGVPGFGGGFIGVDVFFVISGYLITSLLAAEYAEEADLGRGHGRISIPGFYLRRARRILPAAVLVVVAVMIGAHTLLNPLRADEIQHDALWALLFGSNINFIQKATDYFQQGLAASPLQHYWSLAVEEQFYLVWPAMFAIVTRLHGVRVFGMKLWWERRVALVAALVGVGSLAWSVTDTGSDPASAYFSTLTRGWELALGALIGVGMRRSAGLPARVAEALGAGGVALLLLACITIDDTTAFPGSAALIPTLGTGALLLAGAGGRATVVGRVLSVRPARFVGRISYSMYLWHWPLIVFAQALYPVGSASVLGRVALLAATVAVSVASFYLVEQPFRRMGHAPGASRHGRTAGVRRRDRRVQVGLGVAGTAGFVAVVWALLPNAGTQVSVPIGPAPATPSPVAGTVVSGAVAPVVPSGVTTAWLSKVTVGLLMTTLPVTLTPIGKHLSPVPGPCQGRASEVASDRQCQWGHPTAPKRIVIVGDSHAAMFSPAFQLALGDVYHGYLYWLGYCGWQTSAGDPPRETDCPAFQRATLIAVKRLHPDLLVLTQARVGTPSAMSAALHVFKRMATHVVVMAHTPSIPPFATCLSGTKDISACVGRRPLVDRERNAANAAGVLFIDPNQWLCSNIECPGVIDDKAVYWDGGHLTAEFAPTIGPELQVALRAVITPAFRSSWAPGRIFGLDLA